MNLTETLQTITQLQAENALLKEQEAVLQIQLAAVQAELSESSEYESRRWLPTCKSCCA